MRESYRDNGKVKTRTIANLTHWAPERIEALRKALKGDFDGIDGEAVSGEIVGVLFALKQLADQVGMTRVPGPAEQGRLALFLVLARIAHAGSRRSAVRWAEQHAVSDILGLEDFGENDLYAALDWLAAEQTRIEQQLYRRYVDAHAMTPADARQALSRLTYLIYDVNGTRCARLIQPDDGQRILLDALGLHFPRQIAEAV